MTAGTPLDLSLVRISRFADSDSLRRFNCGESEIDRWARNTAPKFAKQNRMRIFVAKSDSESMPLGLYSLSVLNEDCRKLSGRDKDIWAAGVPFVYIGYLAVQRSLQGNGLGTYMLVDCLRRAHWISQHVAFYGLALRSLNEKTTALYTKFGFAIAPGEGEHTPLMVLPIFTINDLFANEASPL